MIPAERGQDSSRWWTVYAVSWNSVHDTVAARWTARRQRENPESTRLAGRSVRTLGVRTKKVLQVAGSHDRNSSSLTTHRGQPNRTRTVRRRLSSAVHYGPESLSTIDGISTWPGGVPQGHGLVLGRLESDPIDLGRKCERRNYVGPIPLSPRIDPGLRVLPSKSGAFNSPSTIMHS